MTGIKKRTIKIPNIELPVGIPIVIEEVVKGRYGYNIFPQGKERQLLLNKLEEEIEKHFGKKPLEEDVKEMNGYRQGMIDGTSRALDDIKSIIAKLREE